jgi:hypothetical protein
VSRPEILITLEGYAVEGGLDVPGGPYTAHNAAIALGQVAGPDHGDRLLERYDEVLSCIADVGVDGIRLTPEWARLAPTPDTLDDTALARYVDVVAEAQTRGLSVTIVLVDSTWPAWLGPDAWMLPWVHDVVLAHARRIALAMPSASIIAFSDAASLVQRGYLEAAGPPWRRRAREEAALATASLARLNELLRADELVGPRLVPSFIAGTASELTTAARTAAQWHVRSALRGRGVTAAPEGLFVERDGHFVPGSAARDLALLLGAFETSTS